MAVFTAIASSIVGATLFGSALAATIATSIIAAGLALGTAKALGVMDPPKQQDMKDPGVKIQLPPSTDNRVPVFYGRSYTGAIIVDAELKNRNNTMVYCMVIGEKTDSGTISVTDIYRDDAKLNFSGATVISATDPNATTSENINGKIRCRVYAGGTAASNQIFPATPQVAATTLMTTIDAGTSFEGLVFSVIEMDYDAENGLQGLGAITYNINNTLNEPSNVLLDYLQNDRYGAGLSSSDLDLTSFNDLYDYSTAQVDYGTASGNVTAQHNRWQIDGMLSSYQPVKTNINEICRSCAAYFAYDPKQGKFKVVSNRAATSAEKSAAYVFNDDNITSSIEITSTELYSLYNSIDAEYPSVDKKDQTQTIIVSTPAGERNANEPDNPLDTRFNLVNDRSRVYNLANIDLNQSRISTVINFTADYSSIVNDVGDIVKVTSSLYGFTNKLFRVMRVTEVETQDAMLGAKFTCIEYDDSIYTHTRIQSDGAVGLSLIPGWWTGIWGNTDIANISNIIGNITIVDDPLSNVANIVDPPTGNIISNVDIGNINIGIGGEGIGSGFGMIPSINFPITIPDIPDISEIKVNVDVTGSSETSNVANTMPPIQIPVVPPKNNTTFIPGEIIDITIPQPPLPPKDQMFSVGPLLGDITANIDLSMINYDGITSAVTTAPNITLAPAGVIDRGRLGSVQAGLQVEEDVANVNSNSSSLVQDSSTANVQIGTANSIITPIDNIDLGGIDEGEYSAINSAVPFGLFGANSILAYQPTRQINYKELDIATDGTITANANADIVDVVGGSGIIASVGTTVLPSINDNFKYEVSRTRGSAVAVASGRPAASATKTYVPSSMDVINFANTNLQEDAANGRFRGFDVTNTDKRITKSDFYIDIGGFF